MSNQPGGSGADGAGQTLPRQEIDAVRRHICHILGFDYGMIDIIRGDQVVNAITFGGEQDDIIDAGALAEFIDMNEQPLTVADSQLAKGVRETLQPWVGRAYPLHRDAAEETPGYPYVIVPIFDGLDDSRLIKGLIRVLTLDDSRTIDSTDVSTLKLIGQNFSARVPYLASVEAGTGQATPAGAPSAIATAQPEHVVIAHADRVVRRRLGRALSARYNVLEVDDANKAFDILSKQPVDLLIADSHMKAPNGTGICAYIRGSGQWKALPIVLITPEGDHTGKVDGLNAGADDCLDADCVEAELIAKVRSLLKLRKTERELSAQLQLLEDYAARLEHYTEEERMASSNLTKQNTELDEMNRELKKSKLEIEIRRNQDKLLHRISSTIRSSFNIESNIAEMLEDLAGWMQLDCCFVSLPGDELEKQDTVRREYFTDEGYKIVEKDLDLAILEKFKSLHHNDEILRVNDVKRDKKVEPFKRDILSGLHIYSLFYVPITYENKLFGILGGHKCESEAQWTPDNETFLKQVADQIAIGVTNARLYRRVERQATSDGLTGLVNHRTGQEKLSEQLRIAERYSKHLSVVMIDVDHFKSINDTYGHPVGDTVLKSVAHVIKRDCRDVDIAVRYGGEEFMLILPEINQEGALVVAERLRKTLSRESIAHDNVQLSVTASLGVSSYPDDATSQHMLLELADKALYLSKRLGRNQVHTATDLMFNEFETQPEHDEHKKAVQTATAAAQAAQAAQAASYEQQAETQNLETDTVMLPEVVEMVKALAGALYAKSEYNKVHHLETARFSEMVGKVLGLSMKQIEQIRVAGLLHDVGLLSIPEEIINKEGQVTSDELRILMQHPTLGAQLFRPIHALKDICDILENHHECWDGTGYPRGLKGEEIPLAARIIAIVDAYHAMISDRPYRPAMPADKAKRVLRNGAGTQFDPLLVDIFLAVLDDTEQNAAQQQQPQ
jgi:diguanylate cyclase (GGDEF)-like protein